MQSFHPLVTPVTRKHRFYVHPETGDAEFTAIVALRLDGRDRYVLAQEPADGGTLIVVADAGGRIPVFGSEAEARAYVTRVFPENTAGDVPTGALQALIDRAGPMQVDLDAVRRWVDNPVSDVIGPALASLAWDLIAGADAGPARVPFDPMGMYALAENLRSGTIDSRTYSIAITGMMIGGFMSEIERRGGGTDSTQPFPKDQAVWGAAERAMLAEILRDGMTALAGRLSGEAARGNVRDTWPTPQPARLVAKPSGWLLHDRDIHIPHAVPDVAALVAGRLGPLPPREQLGMSPEAYARYTRDREEYAEDLRAYFPVMLEHETQEQRSVRINLYVLNQGDRRAEDVMVAFRVPPGLSLVPSGSMDLNPQLPPEPLEPAEYERPDARRKRWEGRRPGYRARGETGMYNARERVVQAADGTVTVELPLGSVAAHDSYQVPEAWLRFNGWTDVGPFDLVVEVREGGTVVSSERMPVRVKGHPAVGG